jgi:sugar lactone lactonase YvrE
MWRIPATTLFAKLRRPAWSLRWPALPVTGSADGSGAAAQFNLPQAIAAEPAGNLYVADTANHIVRKITPAGVVTTLAGTAGLTGSADGSGAVARFNYPQGIATDSAGNVYVTDSGSTIRKIPRRASLPRRPGPPA